MKNNDFDILDLLLILKQYKKAVILVVFISSIFAVAYSLLATKYWVSKATILPAASESSSMPFGNSSILGIGSAFLGGGLQSEAMDLILIMNSRTFSESVVDKFKLVDYFEIDEENNLISYELAIEKLKEEVVSIGVDEENGLISIKVETKDKHLSSQIANYYCDQLEVYNQSSRTTKGKQKRIFIETRLSEIENEINKLTNHLLEFNNKNHTIELNSQISASIDLYSDLVSQKYLNDIELEFQRKFSYTTDLKLEQLEIKQDLLNKKLRNLEVNGEDNELKYIIPLSSISQKSIELSKIKLNLEIQEKIYNYLYPQFEQAHIEEIKDLPTIEIIDKAKPAGRRSKPKRAKICVFTFILSFFTSIFVAILIERFKIYLRSEDALEKIEKMKNMK